MTINNMVWLTGRARGYNDRYYKVIINFFIDDQSILRSMKYANAGVFSSILSVLFGFSFGVINLAFFLVALSTSLFAFVSGKGNPGIRTKSIVSWVMLAASITLYFVFGVSGVVMPVM